MKVCVRRLAPLGGGGLGVWLVPFRLMYDFVLISATGGATNVFISLA